MPFAGTAPLGSSRLSVPTIRGQRRRRAAHDGTHPVTNPSPVCARVHWHFTMHVQLGATPHSAGYGLHRFASTQPASASNGGGGPTLDMSQ